MVTKKELEIARRVGEGMAGTILVWEMDNWVPGVSSKRDLAYMWNRDIAPVMGKRKMFLDDVSDEALPGYIGTMLFDAFGTSFGLEKHIDPILLEKTLAPMGARLLSFRGTLPQNKFPRGRKGQMRTWKLVKGDEAYVRRIGLKLLKSTKNLCRGKDDFSGMEKSVQESIFNQFEGLNGSTMYTSDAFYVTILYGDETSKDQIIGVAKVEMLKPYWDIIYFCAKGGGAAQMRKIIEDARNTQGVKGVELSALPTAVTFYRRLGYKNVRVREGYEKEGCPEPLRIKLLAQSIKKMPQGATLGQILADESLKRFFAALARDAGCTGELEECILSYLYRMRICFPPKKRKRA